MEETKRELVKVTNPDYLQQSMWPLIVEFVDIQKTPGISAHSLMTAFLYSLPDASIELWAAIKDGKCIGFITFQIMGPPYYSTGQAGNWYMQDKDQELISQMYDMHVEFMKRYQLKYWLFGVLPRKLAKKFEVEYGKRGLEFTQKGYTYAGIRKIKGN